MTGARFGRAWLGLFLLAFVVPSGTARADVVFDDGQFHLIDFVIPRTQGKVIVRDDSGGATTSVRVSNGTLEEGLTLEGASVGTLTSGLIGHYDVSRPLQVGGDSTFNMSGGVVGGDSQSMILSDNATFNMTAGFVDWDVNIEGNAVANVSGDKVAGRLGTILGEDVSLRDNSIMNLSGLAAIGYQLQVYDNATLHTSGSNFLGTFFTAQGGNIVLDGASVTRETSFLGSSTVSVLSCDCGSFTTIGGDAVVDIAGGVFEDEFRVGGNASLTISGGEFVGGFSSSPAFLQLSGGSTTTIFGLGFNLPFGPVTASSGDLQGTLADGTSLDVAFSRSGTLILAPVPEPTGALIFAVGLGVLSQRFRRRTAR